MADFDNICNLMIYSRNEKQYMFFRIRYIFSLVCLTCIFQSKNLKPTQFSQKAPYETPLFTRHLVIAIKTSLSKIVKTIKPIHISFHL